MISLTWPPLEDSSYTRLQIADNLQQFVSRKNRNFPTFWENLACEKQLLKLPGSCIDPIYNFNMLAAQALRR
jgi:hypothetical protein